MTTPSTKALHVNNGLLVQVTTIAPGSIRDFSTLKLYLFESCTILYQMDISKFQFDATGEKSAKGGYWLPSGDFRLVKRKKEIYNF